MLEPPVHRSEEDAVVTAIVLIQAAAERIPEAAQEIADIDGVTEVYSCAGDVDLIALVRVRTVTSGSARRC